MAAMKDTTPYRLRPPTEIAREQACMRIVFAPAEAVTHVWEAFCGIGVTAEVLRQKWPVSQIVGCDLDAECVTEYNRRGFGIGAQMDCLEHFDATIGRWRPRLWGASLDYNKLTIMDLRGERPGQATDWKVKLLEKVFAEDPSWVQITDSACRYLHLNWERYGLAANDAGLYAKALGAEVKKRWGFNLKTWDKHHAASYLLFVKGK